MNSFCFPKYNWNKEYFMPDWNMKPRKKTTRMKNGVQWWIHKRVGKYIGRYLEIDMRRDLDYRMIFRGHKRG